MFHRVAFVVGGDLIKCSRKILPRESATINFNNGNVSVPPPRQVKSQKRIRSAFFSINFRSITNAYSYYNKAIHRAEKASESNINN